MHDHPHAHVVKTAMQPPPALPSFFCLLPLQFASPFQHLSIAAFNYYLSSTICFHHLAQQSSTRNELALNRQHSARADAMNDEWRRMIVKEYQRVIAMCGEWNAK